MSENDHRAQEYADGELTGDEAAAFRRHVATCEQCAAELEDALQLDLLSQELPVPIRNKKAVRKPPYGLYGLGAVAVAAAALLVPRMIPERAPSSSAARERHSGPEIARALGERRLIEGRVSYPGLDEHREYDPAMSGAGAAGEQIPHMLIGELDDRRDHHGVAVALMLSGGSDTQIGRAFERAWAALGRAPRAPEVRQLASDHAVYLLSRGDSQGALTKLDEAMADTPSASLQATWNLALALDVMRLGMAAAEKFAAVAARGEAGWSQEARTRADAARSPVERRKNDWTRWFTAGRQWALGNQPLPEDMVAQQPDLVRFYLYEVIRMAPSREEVERLLPLAAKLDAHYGGTEITAYVKRRSEASFARRRSLLATYRKLLDAGNQSASLSPDEMERFLAQVRASGQDDLLMGAMIRVRRGKIPTRELAAYRALATGLGDRWHRLLADEQEAGRLIDGREYDRAELLLLPALKACHEARIPYRCVRIAQLLGEVYLARHHPARALEYVEPGWKLATSEGLYTDEATFLAQLARIAHMRDDISGQGLPVARAFLRERYLRDGGACPSFHYMNETLATMLLNRGRRDEARAQLDAPDPTGECEAPPPEQWSLQRVFAASQLVTAVTPQAEVDAVLAAVNALRGSGRSPAFVDHVEGRALLARDPDAATAALRRAIAVSESAPASDSNASKARAYSYALLILDAARRGEPGRALELLAEERGVRPPSRCAVGLAAEDAALVIVRGADGDALAPSWHEYAPHPSGPRVPGLSAEMLRALAGCEIVDVLARAPFYGRGLALPRDIAWRYLTREPRGPSGAARRRLVVSDVVFPAELELPRLSARPKDVSGPHVTHLQEQRATPARVLASMATATEIDFYVHGVVDEKGSDTAYLALTPDPTTQQYRLTAEMVRGVSLKGSPAVVLAACEAAHTASYFHEPWSLARAFLDAGARAVVASPASIQNVDAGEFFSSLLDRIAAGVPPAIALRDLRRQYSRPDQVAWIDQMVVFE